MEDQLSEELLDTVTGGTRGASSSGGNGRVEDCRACSFRLHLYNSAKATHEDHETQLDNAAIAGNSNSVNEHKRLADYFYNLARQQHQKIIVHGHVDFPPAQNPPVGQ